MTLWIDADACPVKEEAERVATRHKLPMKLVANGGLRPSRNPWVEVVIVAEGLDVADDHIAEHCGPGDVVVTADVPLAARCVEAGAEVLSHTGERFTPSNIGSKLATRDLMTEMRAANPLSQGGGGKAFSKADRSRFLDALEQAVRRASQV
ncbi:YaiI/YqxD family protein [Pseudaestuariivita sp.]|uniref:YaiI/YqxD family protein n=1 Tax=Pseudaestuariivita sp. TaxID=2211669 RepID=UPI00405833E1